MGRVENSMRKLGREAPFVPRRGYVSVDNEIYDHLRYKNPGLLIRFLDLKRLRKTNGGWFYDSNNTPIPLPAHHVTAKSLRALARTLGYAFHTTLNDDLRYFENEGWIAVRKTPRGLIIIFTSYSEKTQSITPASLQKDSILTPHQEPLWERVFSENARCITPFLLQKNSTISNQQIVRSDKSDQIPTPLNRSTICAKSAFFDHFFGALEKIDHYAVKADVRRINRLREDGYEFRDIELVAAVLTQIGIPNANLPPDRWDRLEKVRALEFMTGQGNPMRWLVPAICGQVARAKENNAKGHQGGERFLGLLDRLQASTHPQ
jgi:hypothetical protein